MWPFKSTLLARGPVDPVVQKARPLASACMSCASPLHHDFSAAIHCFAIDTEMHRLWRDFRPRVSGRLGKSLGSYSSRIGSLIHLQCADATALGFVRDTVQVTRPHPYSPCWGAGTPLGACHCRGLSATRRARVWGWSELATTPQNPDFSESTMSRQSTHPT